MQPRVPGRLAALGVLLTLTLVAGSRPASAAAPAGWTRHTATTLSEREGASEAYDAAAAELVVFGGDNTVNTLDDTWVFQGDRWSRLDTPVAPRSRTDAAMVYDPALGKVLLFGGDPHAVDNGISYLGDTWTFDGTRWERLTTAHSPDGRAEASMAWDAADNEVVLFGGLTNTTGVGQDTWTFDGTDWTQQNPTTAPPWRHGAMMAWDATANRVLMFGGLGQPPTGSTNPYLADTWSWSGHQWTQLSSSLLGPQGRWAGAMAEAPGGSIVLFGGYWDSGVGTGSTPAGHAQGPTKTLNDVWTWNGSAWSQSQASGPAARYRAAIAWDPALHEDVLYGGCCNAAGGFLTDTWTFDGSAWTRHERGDAPSVRDGAVAATDVTNGDVVVFGGFGGDGFLGDTWLYSAGAWHQPPASTTAPAGRFAASMAYDTAHHLSVLFGGQAQSANSCSTMPDQLDVNHLCNDTWTFDGSTWTKQAAASASPPGYRSLAGMAYDAATGQTVLYGGFADQAELGDTWTFDGTTWTQQKPATSPPPLSGASLVYDPALQKVVLYGGEGSDPQTGEPKLFDQTWTWDGTTWAQLTPASSPPPLYEAGAIWDPDLGGVLLAAGQGDGGPGVFGTEHDAWLFDGTAWQRQPVGTAPGDRYFAPLAWDPASSAAILTTGLGDDGFADDTWALGAAPAVAVPELPAPPLLLLAALPAVALVTTVRRRRAT